MVHWVWLLHTGVLQAYTNSTDFMGGRGTPNSLRSNVRFWSLTYLALRSPRCTGYCLLLLLTVSITCTRIARRLRELFQQMNNPVGRFELLCSLFPFAQHEVLYLTVPLVLYKVAGLDEHYLPYKYSSNFLIEVGLHATVLCTWCHTCPWFINEWVQDSRLNIYLYE